MVQYPKIYSPVSVNDPKQEPNLSSIVCQLVMKTADALRDRIREMEDQLDNDTRAIDRRA